MTTVFIGDANGADRAVQQHFADRDYRNVTVFCMGTRRNNVGNWEVRKIKSDSSRKDFGYYATKDIAMAQEAKCGVMLWDGRSKGTLHNIRTGEQKTKYDCPAGYDFGQDIVDHETPSSAGFCLQKRAPNRYVMVFLGICHLNIVFHGASSFFML